MKYSGFTFVHDAIAGGYPIREAIKAVGMYCDEVVAVDMESTDGTRQILEDLGCRIIDGKWGAEAEGTLGAAHALHTECRNDTILHFEADEVWDKSLVKRVFYQDMTNAVVYRIQVEQNFQRIRWAPHQVHRVFPRGSAIKDPARGHTTKQHDLITNIIRPEHGMIWDCSYVFLEQYKQRMIQNAQLWGEQPQLLRRTPAHFLESEFATDLEAFLQEPQWRWKTTPLRIPDILLPLVGETRYK